MPAKTAVVVIDMWDRHWCKTFTARVGNMVPRMNRTLDACRKLGIQVVFAPSDVVDFYRDFPQRKAMQAVRSTRSRSSLPSIRHRRRNPPIIASADPDQPCQRAPSGRDNMLTYKSPTRISSPTATTAANCSTFASSVASIH